MRGEDTALCVSDDLLNSGRGRYWQNVESLQTGAGAGPKKKRALWVGQGHPNEHSDLITKKFEPCNSDFKDNQVSVLYLPGGST